VVTEYHGPGNLSKIIDRLPVKFVGGRLCLDFVNTVGGRDQAGAVIRDKIGNYDDLLAWSVLAGMVDRRQARACEIPDPHAAADVLATAARLREALYRIFKCRIERRQAPAADVEVLRHHLTIARAHQYFAEQGGRFVWTFPPQLFLDTSRNRRRQWCDMQDCGNRAKVQRFRRKQRPA
jgi:predicted RNA-binding Zn ribbon-like protein